ncbi:MAG TPA: acyl-CoA thioesterase [Solirubrobacteraceae bacterium]|nr:acyl-CoA thioesterase [Solirubrobacteraceae bacterium]
MVFPRYFETTRIAYQREIVPTHDPANPERDELGLIFAECHINYRSPVVFDELVDVTCSIGNIKRSSFQVEFEMRVGSQLVADGYGVAVGFDDTAKHASPLPDALRETLEAEVAAAGQG